MAEFTSRSFDESLSLLRAATNGSEIENALQGISNQSTGDKNSMKDFLLKISDNSAMIENAKQRRRVKRVLEMIDSETPLVVPQPAKPAPKADFRPTKQPRFEKRIEPKKTIPTPQILKTPLVVPLIPSRPISECLTDLSNAKTGTDVENALNNITQNSLGNRLTLKNKLLEISENPLLIENAKQRRRVKRMLEMIEEWSKTSPPSISSSTSKHSSLHTRVQPNNSSSSPSSSSSSSSSTFLLSVNHQLHEKKQEFRSSLSRSISLLSSFLSSLQSSTSPPSSLPSSSPSPSPSSLSLSPIEEALKGLSLDPLDPGNHADSSLASSLLDLLSSLLTLSSSPPSASSSTYPPPVPSTSDSSSTTSPPTSFSLPSQLKRKITRLVEGIKEKISSSSSSSESIEKEKEQKVKEQKEREEKKKKDEFLLSCVKVDLDDMIISLKSLLSPTPTITTTPTTTPTTTITSTPSPSTPSIPSVFSLISLVEPLLSLSSSLSPSSTPTPIPTPSTTSTSTVMYKLSSPPSPASSSSSPTDSSPLTSPPPPSSLLSPLLLSSSPLLILGNSSSRRTLKRLLSSSSISHSPLCSSELSESFTLWTDRVSSLLSLLEHSEKISQEIREKENQKILLPYSPSISSSPPPTTTTTTPISKPLPVIPYIVFVGNLSYDTSPFELETHLRGLGIEGEIQVRMNTGNETRLRGGEKEGGGEKKDNKSEIETDPTSPSASSSSSSSSSPIFFNRGTAFVSLEGPREMHKTLALHHSILKGRRINMEKSCGGRNREARASKIQAQRSEQRERSEVAIREVMEAFEAENVGLLPRAVESFQAETMERLLALTPSAVREVLTFYQSSLDQWMRGTERGPLEETEGKDVHDDENRGVRGKRGREKEGKEPGKVTEKMIGRVKGKLLEQALKQKELHYLSQPNNNVQQEISS